MALYGSYSMIQVDSDPDALYLGTWPKPAALPFQRSCPCSQQFLFSSTFISDAGLIWIHIKMKWIVCQEDWKTGTRTAHCQDL